VNGQVILKPGHEVTASSEITILSSNSDYVSRSAYKLIAGLDHFGIEVKGRNAIDVGASTGGFTEVLLEREAKQVHAVDVGSGQIAEKLRQDPRVRVIENYNARTLRPEDFGSRFNLLVMDVSFISIRLILPAALTCLTDGSDLIVLFKPQFEVGRDHIGRGGIVTDQSVAQESLQATLEWGKDRGLTPQGTLASPIKGGDGNQEYLISWTYPKSSS
jgi:23S rRNA (cytidine1920-2'-O)/16S rRNA (cytidine1409-2'-O)-methyltransferase